METIAQKLREYFDSQGITQQDIANKFGVKKQTINPYITGAKPFGKKVAQQWADAFGLSVSWLLTGEGEMLKGSAERSDVSLCFETIQGGIGHGTGIHPWQTCFIDGEGSRTVRMIKTAEWHTEIGGEVLAGGYDGYGIITYSMI